MRLPNSNRIFGGDTPLAYMVSGGVPAMQTVRRLLDARRAACDGGTPLTVVVRRYDTHRLISVEIQRTRQRARPHRGR